MIDSCAPDFLNTPVSAGRPQYRCAPSDQLATPVVSIVTSLPSTGERLRATAQTIRGQSLQQWEWLIPCTQSSAANVSTELSDGRAVDARIHILGGQSENIVASRNVATTVARAPFVVFVESGDMLEQTALEKMVWFLSSHPEHAFVASHSIILGTPPRLAHDGFHDGGSFFEQKHHRRNVLIRREVFARVGNFDDSLSAGEAERDFWRRCANAGHWGSTVKEFLSWLPSLPDLNANTVHRPLKAPDIQSRSHLPYDEVPNDLPVTNVLTKTRRRALLIVPWLTMGGSDKFNVDLVGQLVGHHDYEITIATTLTGDQSRMPLFAEFTPDIFVLNNFLRLVDYPRFLRYLIESRQIDVVLLSHSHLGYQLLPYLRAHCPQATYVDYCHIEELNWRNGGYPRFSINYQALLDLAIVSSDHLKQWMTARGGYPARVEVCHTNIDPQRWAPDPQVRECVRRELSVASDTPVVLFAGRLCDQKQPQVLAEVARRLHEKDIDFITLVAGDGEDRASLEAFVQSHGLSATVRLLGAMPYARVRELMCASDIFFLPSKWEGIALSLFEAMSCGLAVVGADVGGQRELVTSDCGILVSRADEATEAAHYTVALEKLLRDPQRRAAFGEQARKRIIKQFQLDSMGRQMVDLFHRAQELHRIQPRETPSRALGLACATEAIEYARLIGVADQLWQQQNQKSPTVAPQSTNGGNVWSRLARRVRHRRPPQPAALGKTRS